jgi:hypothetical protein
MELLRVPTTAGGVLCAESSLVVSDREAAMFLMPGDKIVIEGLFADTFGIVLYGQSGTANPCACSPTGLSGGASVAFKGCAYHPDENSWCYVNGGVQCAKATPDAANPGAAWRYCSPGAEAALAASRDILFRFSPNPHRGTIARNDAFATYPCSAPRAAYVYGDSDSNKCPAGYVRIMDGQACESAATTMGESWNSDLKNRNDRPRGCYLSKEEEGGMNVYLNSHPVGSGFPHRLLLCARTQKSLSNICAACV